MQVARAKERRRVAALARERDGGEERLGGAWYVAPSLASGHLLFCHYKASTRILYRQDTVGEPRSCSCVRTCVSIRARGLSSSFCMWHTLHTITCVPIVAECVHTRLRRTPHFLKMLTRRMIAVYLLIRTVFVKSDFLLTRNHFEQKNSDFNDTLCKCRVR